MKKSVLIPIAIIGIIVGTTIHSCKNDIVDLTIPEDTTSTPPPTSGDCNTDTIGGIPVQVCVIPGECDTIVTCDLQTNTCDTLVLCQITWDNGIESIITTNCASSGVCHGSGAVGKPELHTYNVAIDDTNRIRARALDANPSAMPAAGLIPQPQRDSISLWLSVGAPEN